MPEAVWCMHCGAGSRMSFIPNQYNFHCPYCDKWNILEKPIYIKETLKTIESGRIKSGISQVGGKYRLMNKLLEFVPYHEFFLSMFSGACWMELNKPRTRYECYNDYESEIIIHMIQ